MLLVDMCLESMDFAVSCLIMSSGYRNHVEMIQCGRIEGIKFLCIPELLQCYGANGHNRRV